jgi:hypothetical protein
LLSQALVLLIGGAAWSAHATAVTAVTLTNYPAGGVTVTNGLLVPVSAAAVVDGSPTIVSMTLHFRIQAPLCTNLWNDLAMTTNGSPTTFAATLPRLPAANVDYYAQCVWQDGIGGTFTNLSATNSYVVSALLGSPRNQDFEGGNWTSLGSPNYNCYSSDGWTGTMMRVSSNTILRTPPLNSSNFGMWLRNGTNTLGELAYIMSPVLPEGVGTISFESVVRNSAYSNVVAVLIFTNNAPSWDTLLTITNSASVTSLVSVARNLRVPLRVRLQRMNNVPGDLPSTSSSAGVLDNIRVTLPPADLTITTNGLPVLPDFPAALDPVTLRCALQDVDTNVATFNRQVTLWYQFVSTNGVTNSWVSQTMTNVPGVPGQFAGVVSGLNAGTNFYYYQAAFDGYYFTNTDRRSPESLPANAPTNLFSYTILDKQVRTIRLVAPYGMDFSKVTTNAYSNLTLLVCNDGNMPLTVSNIVFGASGFSVSTSSFLVPIGATQAVSVIFHPTAGQGVYNDVLSVQSDKTDGVDTQAVTGVALESEFLTTPAAAADGITYGTLGDTLGFHVSQTSTDNWDYVVQYNFDWGDGAFSGWSYATSASHSWSSNGAFNVRVGARSSTNAGVTSGWSAAVPVTITNTQIMGLSGNLDFGVQGVNAQPFTRTLTVTNSGNGTMHVTDITSASGLFSASPKVFAVPPFGTTPVQVTFAPTAEGSFTSLLTVVASDMTSGVNTTNATGSAEQLAMLGLTPTNSAGTINESLAFAAYATNSTTAEALNVRFDWGDGQTSGWVTATASHSWAAPSNSYHVYAQAQCQGHPNALSAWYGPVSVLVTNTRILGLSGSNNFSTVVTNLPATRLLTLTNSGNGLLTVSDLVFSTNAFQAAPTSFTIPPFGATNVTVTFTPPGPGPCAGTLTAYSDATSGSNTYAYAGFGETVYQPQLSPTNFAATLAQVLTYSATASNNTSDSMQYFFDWGDGQNSGWTNNTATHAWGTTNTFTLSVRARCATHTNALSVLSDFATLSITNTRVMGLSPSTLTFGFIMTNETAARVLTVTNSGNNAFQVTAVNCPAGYSGTTNFTLAASNSAPVVLTFAPNAGPGSYTGTVTVVSPDFTAGGNTVAVTGFCEYVSAPLVVVNTVAGHTNDALGFTYAATNNSNHGLQYFFSWGDGQTSGWASAATTSHVWSATNTYAVTVQARCVDHTNVVSSWSSTNLVGIYEPPTFAFSPVTNGQPFRVTATTTGAPPGSVSNCVFYYLPPGSTNAQPAPLAFVSGNDWTALLPPLNPGVMHYYLAYMRSGASLQYPALTPSTFNVTNDLGLARQTGFEDTWTQNGGTNNYNYYNNYGWTGTMMRVVSNSYLRTPPLNNSNIGIWLRSGTNQLGQLAFVESPVLANGIGCIYFEIGIRSSSASTGFRVKYSTDNGTNWVTCYSNTVSGSTIQYPAIKLNLRQPARVLIERTENPPGDVGLNNTAPVIDNIIISPPPTDVSIAETLHNPGYPNSKDPTLVRCQTTDYAGSAPSVNRRLTLYYKHETASVFTPTNMYATGVDTYEGVVPAHRPGEMSYFFKCEFDGYFYTNSVITNATPPFASENISPSYLPDQRPGPVLATYPLPAAPYHTYRINLFRSEHSDMRLATTPDSVAVDMDLVGDYTWQGLTLMRGITNLTWFFVGASPYSNNATAFGVPVSWGDTNQDFPYPPMGGLADVCTNALRAELEYDGFLVYRFVTTNGEYLVRRAVYQNFDDWPGDPDYFEGESFGLYGAKTYTNNFELWGPDVYPPYMSRTESFSIESTGVWYSTPQVTLDKWWSSEQAQVVGERAFQSPGFTASANRGLWLNPSPSAPGRVWNTTDGITEGIRNFTFRARLGQNDGRYAVYTRELANLTNGSPWTASYRVTNAIRASTMSPGAASLSLLMCYSRDYINNPFDLGSFYEFRMCQVSPSSAADDIMQLQLYRWVDGAPTLVPFNGGTTITTVGSGHKLVTPSSTAPLIVDIAWTNIGNSVAFTGRVSRAGSTVFAFTTNQCVDSGATPRLRNGGSVGFLCSEAEAEVQYLAVYSGIGQDPASRIPMDDYSGGSNWFFGGKHTTDPANWWQVVVAGATTNLVRPLPTQKPALSLYSIRAGVSGTRNPDLTAWATNAVNLSVQSYDYASYTQPFNTWDPTFVMLQQTYGDQPIVVDSPTIDPWRAYTRGYADSNFANQAISDGVLSWDWTAAGQQNTNSLSERGWSVYEGMVVRSNANTYASFDVTRANSPPLAQGLWSPVITNGVGTLYFSAWAGAGTSVYRVDAATSGSLTQWRTVKYFTNTVADGISTRVVPVRVAGITGRVRIVQEPPVYTSGVWAANSSSNAILNLDNVVVRNYPPRSDTTWVAYNCLIASPTTNNGTYDAVTPANSRAFETASNLLSHQTCYLNNGATNDVFPGTVLNDSIPYVQTPRVGTGIGEIAFWYRAWDATNPAYVSICAAPNETVPVSQWTNIVSFTVTNTTYAYTNISVFDPDDQVMRIYVATNTLTNACGRLCIDNLLMTEPVRAGYDIVDVTLLPTQPLMTDTVGLQATIGRFLMNPQDIHLYLSYSLQTNTWGYANWRGRGKDPLTNFCQTIQLEPVDSRTFRTPSGSNIPQRSIDDVVQFVVWGTFSNFNDRPVFQTTNTFRNPAWYYPVDLNPTNGLGQYLAPTNWSPYYFVFSCLPGSVWINEFNYVVKPLTEQGYEYIELCGAVNTDISRWRIDVIDPLNSFSVYGQATVPDSTQIQEEYLSDGSLSGDGWGFWVWGGSYVYIPGPLDEWGYPSYRQANLVGDDTQHTLLLANAGLRVVRSMGAYEQRICYGPSFINSELVARGYEYVGAKHTLPPWEAPLQLQGSGNGWTNSVYPNASITNDFFWYQPSPYTHTPGGINNGENLLAQDVYYMLYSAIGLNGLQSGGSPLVAVRLAAGASTQIVYTANDWYRIGTLTSDGSAVPAASGTKQYTWTLSGITHDVTNNVTFNILPDSQNGAGVPTYWLASFGQGESTPFDNDPYGTRNEYLLNMSPYVSNAVSFRVSALGVTGATVRVTVQLLESTNGVAYYAPTNGIYGTLSVYATSNLVSGIWTNVASTNIPPPDPSMFDANGRRVFTFPGTTGSFYQAKVIDPAL